MAEREDWGGRLSCARCGHPSAYHGTTFCMVDAGAEAKRRCDCSGWPAQPEPSAPEGLDAAWAEVDALTGGRLLAIGRGPHGFDAEVRPSAPENQMGYGPTPAAAVRNLAANIRAYREATR